MAIAATYLLSHGPSGSARASPASGRRVVWLAPLFGLLLASTGCTVHYGNARRGVETVWGLGRVTWAVERFTNDWTRVSSGTRLPGIVLGVGPDFLGLAVGCQIRERLQVVSAVNSDEVRASINGRELAATNGHHWGIGRITLRTPPRSDVVVNGRAGAGIGLGLENGHPAAAIGWQSRQFTTVSGADVFVELTMPVRPWPHFDFPATTVAMMAATNLTLRSSAP